MPRPLRKRFEGARYHITVRGNRRARIFLTNADRERFLEQLDHSLEQDAVVLYAYVLMPNHYHLFLETPRANIDRFMGRLNTAYATYFRYKHAQPGHVLQGRYGAKVVGGDDYILALTRYIHLNPIKVDRMTKYPLAERLAYLRSYPWSSYRGYVSAASEQERTDYRWRSLIGGTTVSAQRTRYKAYVERAAGENDEMITAAMKRSNYAIGDEEFVGVVEKDFDELRHAQKYSQDVIWARDAAVPLEEINRVVASVFGIKPDLLKRHGRAAGHAKLVAVEMACRYGGLSQRDVGKRYGVSGMGVTHQRRRLRDHLRGTRSLRERLERVERNIRNVKC